MTAMVAYIYEPAFFPGAEELRMLRAIALMALLEAAHHGNYSASFHGFRVCAVRGSIARGSNAAIEVSFLVTRGEMPLERGVVAVCARRHPYHRSPRENALATDLGEMEPIAGTSVMLI